MKYRLQSMVGRAASIVSPFYSLVYPKIIQNKWTVPLADIVICKVQRMRVLL